MTVPGPMEAVPVLALEAAVVKVPLPAGVLMNTELPLSPLEMLCSALSCTRLNQGLEQVSGAINHLDLVQASVGARINAVSTAQTAAQSQQTDYQTAVSQLSNVDYAKATTQLSTEELALQAAQASYASMMSLTLFKYI